MNTLSQTSKFHHKLISFHREGRRLAGWQEGQSVLAEDEVVQQYFCTTTFET